MKDVAIRVSNLGKRYRIGARQKKTTTLRESLVNALTSPFGYLRSTLRGPTEAEILWALKDVSFDIMQGEVIGIVGRNGAGKSTLLKILSRITEPTVGRAEVYGRVGSLLEVGTGFHPELTGRENTFLNGAILGMSRQEIENKFDEIVAFAEVEKFIDTPVKRYSSGMYVRLAFAVAAHLEPEILLLDEVLAVGDTSFQNKCLSKVRSLTQQGITTLFVSHNMHLIQMIAQQCLYFKGGNVHYFDDARQAIELYLREAQGAEEFSNGCEPQEKSVAAHEKKDCEILSVSAVSSSGSTEIQPGEDLLIKIRYRFASPPEDVHFNVSVWAENGLQVTSGDSRIGGLNGFRPQAEGEIVCRFPSPPLVAGKFSVRAYVLSHLDWPLASYGWTDDRVCWFAVKPVAMDMVTAMNWFITHADYGVIKVPFQWEPPTNGAQNHAE
jgi:lipopolysaccharide transport system ATP-binding protein